MSSNAAPGDLELVRGFANTLDVEVGTDELSDEDRFSAWLRKCGLDAGSRIDSKDLDLARRTRDALRALLEENSGAEPDASAYETLSEAGERAGFTLRFGGGPEVTLVPSAGGVPGALGVVLSAVSDAVAGGTFERLKICRNEECAWAFYDRAKNRSGKWCDMSVCGNRVKARNYRRRGQQSA